MDKKIEPTDAMVEKVALGHKLMSMDDRTILRLALNHPDAPGLFADEDDLRAAREQGWDQATRWIDSYQGGPNGRTTSARSANPYRPVQELPPERDGVVLVPADGHESITTTDGQEFSRLTFTTKQSIWYGPNLAAQLGDLVIQTTVADRLTPGTWRAA